MYWLIADYGGALNWFILIIYYLYIYKMGNDFGCSCFPTNYKKDPRSIVVDLSYDKQPHVNKKRSQQKQIITPQFYESSPKQHLLVNNGHN